MDINLRLTMVSNSLYLEVRVKHLHVEYLNILI